MNPAAMKARLQALAYVNVLTDIREFPWSTKTNIAEERNFTAAGTVNYLVYNNIGL